MVVAWSQANGALVGIPHQRRCSRPATAQVYWGRRPHPGPRVWTTQSHHEQGNLLWTSKRVEFKLFHSWDKRKGLFISGIGMTRCNLAKHLSKPLRCQVRAKLEEHLPSTSCADYLERMFLIHLHITHPGVVARAMWWPEEPKESFIMFLKQVSLCWLSLGAKKLHSFSPVTSKRGSVNPRVSSDLDSGTVCSDPEGGLRRSLCWVWFPRWVKLTAGTAWTLCSHLYTTCGIQPLPASVGSGLTWSQEGTGPRWLTFWETFGKVHMRTGSGARTPMAASY